MVILGSTGSIGTQSLQIATKFGIKIEALAARKNVKLLNEQIAKFAPKFVYIEDENLVSQIDHLDHRIVFFGKDGIEKMLFECQSQCVINALVGFAGLMPSFTTQRLGKTLCLANKESFSDHGKWRSVSRYATLRFSECDLCRRFAPSKLANGRKNHDR